MIVCACKEYESKISALIDEDLTEEERREVLEHIAACPTCKAYWEDLLALGHALREETPAPVGFADAIMARVRETAQESVPEKKVLRFPGWKRYVGMAAAFAVVLLGVWMLDLSPPGLDNYAVSNSSAPESCSLEDAGADTRSADANTAVSGFAADETSASAESDADGAATYGAVLPESCKQDCAAVLTTGSDLAANWVAENLGKTWVSGESYSLTPEQYHALRAQLQANNEPFTEITGSETADSYLLQAE